MAVDKKFLRQQILAQLDRCTALAYAAGSHFVQHGKHAPTSMRAQAEADARLIHLIEDYAALGVTPCAPASDPVIAWLLVLNGEAVDSTVDRNEAGAWQANGGDVRALAERTHGVIVPAAPQQEKP